jgi:transcriptional regulator with XRE-family HTH domain
MSEFTDWLSNQLDTKNLSMRDLAKRSKLSQSNISKVISGKVAPTTGFCVAIAHALEVSEIDTLHRAGLITEKPVAMDETMIREIMGIVLQLTPDQREFIMMFAKMIQSGKISIHINKDRIKGFFELES